MTTVLLLRHGRTRANAEGLLAGRTPGVDLDGVGRRQARSLGTRLKDVGLTAVVHSPLERCVQTARAVAAAQPGQVDLHSERRLVECDYGQWTGGTLAVLAQDPMWVNVQQRPSQVVFPGGEAMADMAARAVEAVRDWCARHPEGVIAMVSHGDVIKAILADALGTPLDEFQRIAVGPGSMSVVSYGGGRPMVLRVNDTPGRVRLGSQSARPTVGGGAG
jgi:probable phosphomutase (TIGR03848 family)